MGFSTDYFKQPEGAPEPLEAVCTRRARFEEVDSVNMVWHGRFPSYLEDGRIAFGDKYGLTYQSFRENMTVAPIVQMHIDYKIPIRFDQTVEIITRLHFSEAARINFSYHIKNGSQTHATAYTVQLLTEVNGSMLLAPPEWLQAFNQKWCAGYWSKK